MNNAATTATTEPLTDAMILGLHREASESQDDAMRIICDMALGREKPVPAGEAFEERFGGGGFDRDETRAIMAVTSVDDARRECAEVITHARSMAVEDPADLVTVVAE